MSVGCFVGPVRSSYIDESQDAAASFVAGIDSVLRQNGLPGYSEPAAAPDVYDGGLFGRSALDHHSAGCLVELAEMATRKGHAPHVGLLAVNPYRVTFVPVDFDRPLPTGYWERIAGDQIEIWVGSVPRLLAELAALAPALGIPLTDGQLADEVATQINDFAALYDGDDRSLAEDQRTAWLLLYEGARLAAQHAVALSLAG